MQKPSCRDHNVERPHPKHFPFRTTLSFLCRWGGYRWGEWLGVYRLGLWVCCCGGWSGVQCLCWSWAGALATVAWSPVLFITNCAIWIIAAFTVAWIVSLRLTEDEEDVSIKPLSRVLATSPRSSIDLGFRINIWPRIAVLRLLMALLTKCVSLKSKSQSVNWNTWMKLSTDSWSSCLTSSRSDSQPSSLNLLKNASLNTSKFIWVAPPKWETNASLILWR